MQPTITVIGNGSWSSALVKILQDNGHSIHWWMRSEAAITHLAETGHNPHYLTMVQYQMERITLHHHLEKAILAADWIILGIPSAFIADTLQRLPRDIFSGKKIISAVKGIIPGENILVNEYLSAHFNINLEEYCCISGPCHAEEVAAEKLSYLTFAGTDEALARQVANYFEGKNLRTIVSNDVYGVQFAAVLKNIYALGAGIAHGLDYGDNFLSVYITNCFAELQQFMNVSSRQMQHHYNTSAYLGDLLVTCYSLHSRNRTFGNFIGKGYSVAAAKLELNMVAEGYYASKGIYEISVRLAYELPIAHAIYQILWQQKNPINAFRSIEKIFS